MDRRTVMLDRRRRHDITRRSPIDRRRLERRSGERRRLAEELKK